MRFKKVLFVIPKLEHSYPESPHNGIGYLSEYLTENNVDNDIIDMRLGYSITDVLKKIKIYSPDLIGVTTTTYNRDICYDVINKLKRNGCTVVMGGPHVSTIRKDVLKECNADYAIKLEGEHALLELCRGNDLPSIKNLIYGQNGEIIENEDRPFLIDLDQLPFPKHAKAELDKYKKSSTSIITSRGCPYQCIYCASKLVMGRLFRKRSPKNVLEEIKYWYERGVRYIHILDDNFTLDKNRTMEICALIKKENIIATFACDGVRADKIDTELLTTLNDCGVEYLSFGVEGGNNKVLRAIKKGETIEQIEQAIKQSCDMGFKVYLFFIVGSPGETPADVEDSIKLVQKYPIVGANFYNLIPFPGTELYDYVQKNNYFAVQPSEYLKFVPYYGNTPVFATPEFSYEDRKKALAKTRAIGQQIRNKVLKRRLTRFGLLGRVGYLFLRYNFVKEKLVDKLVSRSTFFRKFVSKKTSEVFTKK